MTDIHVDSVPPSDGSGYAVVDHLFVTDAGQLWAVRTVPVAPPPPPVTPPPVTPPPVTPPPVTPPPNPGGTLTGDVWIGLLKFGTTDSDSVRHMQERLNQISFPPNTNIAVSGNYDAETDACVIAWQTFIGNTPDASGQSSIGPNQAAKLFAGTGVTLHDGVPGGNTPPPPAPPPPAATPTVYLSKLHYGQTASDSVTALQNKLNATSFPPHTDVAVNGNYDDATDQSVRDWQVFAGYGADPQHASSVGPVQAAKLFGGSANIVNDLSSNPPPAPPPPAPSGNVSTPFDGAVITNPYGVPGPWAAGYHTGDDFACNTGTPIRTMWSGHVVSLNSWGPAYGNHVVLQFTDYNGATRQMGFCHLSRIDVSVGQQLSSGGHIGQSGATGNVTGPHLHLEQRKAPFQYHNVDVKPVY